MKFYKYFILIMVISVKYVIIDFLLFFILILFLVNKLPDDTIYPVFEETVNSLDFELVSIRTKGLTTKNFLNYFEDTSLIVSIYPDINVLYKERIGNVSFDCKRNCVITDLEKKYKKILDKNYFFHDSALVDYQGFSIEKIIVHANSEKLSNLLKKCSICKTK